MNLSEMTLTWVSVLFFTTCVFSYRAYHVSVNAALAGRQRIFFALAALVCAGLAIYLAVR